MIDTRTALLMENLEKYRQLAITAGMDDARIIKSSDVLIDERVRLKCRYPRCQHFGCCSNCPPYAAPLDEIRKAVGAYHYGIFMKKHYPSSEYLGPNAVNQETGKSRSTQPLMYKVIYEVESAAFRDGYELAMGFANGPCKKLFCSNVECSAIQPGGKCRFPLQSRSSMEGCGMRAMEMARKAGWDIYPAGHSSSPEQVPHLLALGLVMID